MKSAKQYLLVFFFLIISIPLQAQDSAWVAANYNKHEYRIPMRDGVKLFTAVYVPKDTTQDYPVILNRTPYSVGPYGESNFDAPLGPAMSFTKEGYIFVYQDVRGKFMSEGEFEDVRPNRSDPAQVDESRDTYDTIEWLINHIRHNNGKVGMWGISYPGFYAAMGAIDAHPALKAVSPQAPIADWFIDDDFHRNGVFWLPHAFNFYAVFGQPRTGLTNRWGRGFNHGTPDGYKFFLEMGPLANANNKYFHNKIAFWNDVMEHPDYDKFWQERNLLPHLKNIKPAVLVVGGWFDAEDLYGALHVYRAIAAQSPETDSRLVMGPWFHGGWERSPGDALGDIRFGSRTSEYFMDKIELPFFNHYLKGKGEFNAAKITAFETGSNEWKGFSKFPPNNVKKEKLFLQENGKLSFKAPAAQKKDSYDEYISDPNKPVPFTNSIVNRMTREYIVEDQRFASTRPDVLVYTSDVLTDNVTVTGSMKADLFVSTTGTDADFVVKLIDVYPDDAPDNVPNPKNVRMGGYEMMVRGEIMRGKYRESFEKPKAFEPGKVTQVDFELQDINHTFLKNHRIMVQIQSSWFPLADRNPQTFVNIYKAKESDFKKAEHRIYHSAEYPSGIYMNLFYDTN